VLLVLAAPIGEYTQTFYNIKIFADFLNVCSTNILVLLVFAAPIGEYTQTFYNIKIFADFLNVCSTNILVLTGLQH
jgi:TM2 domain-containing membrane protein YozV